MSERNKEVYRLHIKEKMTYSQVAERMGMTRSAVASVIYKRRQKAKELLNASI